MSTFQLLNQVTEIVVIVKALCFHRPSQLRISATSENSQAGAQTYEMGETAAALNVWY
jgi:hypothetical protein